MTQALVGALFALPRIATDQRTIAERKWRAGLKPAKPQKACDHGLFGDSHLQADLDLIVEMFAGPTNEE